MRTERREIQALITAKTDITLSDGQFFCSTPKAFEIWQEEPLVMVKRIQTKAVLWTIDKKETA